MDVVTIPLAMVDRLPAFTVSTESDFHATPMFFLMRSTISSAVIGAAPGILPADANGAAATRAANSRLERTAICAKDSAEGKISGMRRLALVLLAISVPIAPRSGRAQPPSLSAARLHASVEIDSHGVFVYRYTVENGAESTVGISKLTIDMPSKAVPIFGMSAPQPGWRTTIGADATARYVAVNGASLVLPNQRLAGFSLASHSPPALGRFTLAPHIDPDRAPIMDPGDDPGELDRYKQDFDQYVEARSVTGMTLAPTAPVKMTADAVLANVASQIVQARSLRWISSDVVMRSVTQKLQAARAAISRRQFESAGNILRALRNEVAGQSGKTLTSEAVALVDVNIQYVLRLVAKP